MSEDYDASSSSTPYSFTGKEYTEDTGLFYFEARWYDPLIGRFVSSDPISQQNPAKLIMDPQAFNYYAYSRNNPVNRIDPTGKFSYIDSAREVASGMIKIYDYATGNHYTSFFFSNALSDTPRNISFGNDSSLANTIRDTSEYGTEISGIQSEIAEGTLSGGSTIIFENGDLHTSLNEVAYTWNATENEDGTYTIDINMTDPYNFKIENYGDLAGDIINNLGSRLEQTNKIV